LRHIVNSIAALHDEWDERIAHAVLDKLVDARETAISDFVHLKKKYDKMFTADKVIIFELEFPDGSDIGEWLAYVKKAAMRIEQFRSHALRRNPDPRKPRKPGARIDERDARDPIEQEWLAAEDQLTKQRGKKHKHPKKEGEHEKKRKPRRKHTKKGPKHGIPAHDHSRPPVRDGKPMPVTPANTGIAPFKRTDSRQPPRAVGSRLPAFPEFPRYGRN